MRQPLRCQCAQEVVSRCQPPTKALQRDGEMLRTEPKMERRPASVGTPPLALTMEATRVPGKRQIQSQSNRGKRNQIERVTGRGRCVLWRSCISRLTLISHPFHQSLSVATAISTKKSLKLSKPQICAFFGEGFGIRGTPRVASPAVSIAGPKVQALLELTNHKPPELAPVHSPDHHMSKVRGQGQRRAQWWSRQLVTVMASR